MVLAVSDLRPGRRLVVEDERARVEGARLAELFDGYWAGLEAPASRRRTSCPTRPVRRTSSTPSSSCPTGT